MFGIITDRHGLNDQQLRIMRVGDVYSRTFGILLAELYM